MSLKKEIINSVLSPNDNINKTLFYLAQILDTDEANNTCTISLINDENTPVKCSNVPVKIYDPAIFGSFPKKNDIVEVQENNGFYEIISIYNYSYSINIKKDYELKNDIIPNLFQNIGGYIF